MADEIVAAPTPDPIVPVAPNPFETPAPDPAPESWASDKPAGPTAAERLRTFEDTHLGKRAVRINGRVERGFGSPFKEMSPEKHAEYAALEKLVEAERKVDEAHANVTSATVAHETALAELAAASKKASDAEAERQRVADEEAAEAAKPVPAL